LAALPALLMFAPVIALLLLLVVAWSSYTDNKRRNFRDDLKRVDREIKKGDHRFDH